ncbi:nucleobase-ascorbate transporter 4-like isoform X1 [Hevea brasiliensis]|uniref:nucleobase-ascorbate transporter 4-like isoform X1 n=1 Tax=Hevea brasiliensis TaxID=3981 RepID=UPI0025E28112|nr:nucleobase-ascorbate transporter 4-like isoform X1 [Hevea brasiliensis]
MLVSNCSCCQHIPPLDYFPTCPPSHPFHCCQCVPSCHFCQQNKLAFGYCVPSCSTCPVLPTERGPKIESGSGGTTESGSSRTETGSSRTTGRSGGGPAERGTEEIIQFPIPENPSWSNPKLYGWGFQHFVVNVGSTVIVPSVMVSVGGGGNVEKARAIQASLFVMGNTLLQICFGTRLSVSMETSQAYTIPIISIALSTYSNFNNSLDPHQRFEQFMRRVQGASLISSIFQMVIGFSGLAKYFARHLSPLASVPLVTLTGLGLYVRGFPLVAKCAEIGLPALAILVFLTQFLPRIWKAKKEIAGQVAIILSVAIVWTYAEILTVAGAYDNTTQETQMNCRTDSSGLIGAAPWIKNPHPFQWGTPIFEAGDALSMMAASLVAVIESSGTFYASSKLSGAPPIPPYALTRGIGIQGIGTMIDAVFGAGNGSTASVEDAGLLGLTQVGSRRVVIVSAIFMVFLSVLGKVGAFFASIPLPIVGALHTVLFPYVASAGLQYLEFCNVNSFRSKLILGFSLFMGLSVPQYFKEYVFLSGHGPVNTGTTWFNDIVQVIFSSPPTVALIVAFFLDRTHTPGACSTWKDSGRYLKDKSDESEKTKEIYDFIISLGDMCS